MKLELSCACGVCWRGEVNAAGAEVIRASWRKAHSGPGCRPATHAESAAARRRAEAALDRARALERRVAANPKSEIRNPK
jgi:phage gp16-like protein